jgi:dihydrodipicolinate synthase/N-acetylneuraminate lyase
MSGQPLEASNVQGQYPGARHAHARGRLARFRGLGPSPGFPRCGGHGRRRRRRHHRRVAYAGAAEVETLVRRPRLRTSGKLPIIAGSGTNSTARASSFLASAAEAAGADGLLVVTPYYNRPTQEGLYRHFTAIADAVDLPVVLYNVPGRTACDLLPETVVRLSKHPRIVGIKEATGDLARAESILGHCQARLRAAERRRSDGAELMRGGACGVISVTANVAARAMHDMCAAALAGRIPRRLRINEKLMPLHLAMFVEAEPDSGQVGGGPTGPDGAGDPPAADATIRGPGRRDAWLL